MFIKFIKTNYVNVAVNVKPIYLDKQVFFRFLLQL